MRVLVTGASGFIGSTLVDQLHGQGHEVLALMRRTSSSGNLKEGHFRKVEGSLSDLESLKSAVKDIDCVFHLAGVVAASSREDFLENNAAGTARLARAVAEVSAKQLKRFVYVSSLAAGGPSPSPTAPRTEETQDKPVSVYGESKLQGEQELLKHRGNFPISIVRPPMVYGPKDKGVFVIIQTVARHLMPIVRGGASDGKKYYSLVHSEDLCDGIIRASQPATGSGEAFYVAGEGIYSYEELLAIIAQALGVRALKFQIPQIAVSALAHFLAAISRVTGKAFPLNPDKLNEIIPDYWICSNQKAKKVLEFSPKWDLEKGMAQTIQWYRDHGWL